MKEKTKERLLLSGLAILIIAAIASAPLLGLYLDAKSNLEINLKNVGDEAIPFTLYLDGDAVLNGTMQPNETITFILEEALWEWGEDNIFICSVQLPNTIYEREVRDGTDEYFLFD